MAKIKIKITKRSVESLPVREKDHFVFDAEIAGFGVHVMPSGKRFFLVQYRYHGPLPLRHIVRAKATL